MFLVKISVLVRAHLVMVLIEYVGKEFINPVLNSGWWSADAVGQAHLPGVHQMDIQSQLVIASSKLCGLQSE